MAFKSLSLKTIESLSLNENCTCMKPTFVSVSIRVFPELDVDANFVFKIVHLNTMHLKNS